MLIWKALHILSMFTMVAVFIGAEIFYAAATPGPELGRNLPIPLG